MNAGALLNRALLRPVSDVATGAYKLERRLEFLYRDRFERVLRPPLFAAAQAFVNARRPDEGLGLAEERLLPDEERETRAIIDAGVAFMREQYPTGTVQRFGNTKTYGVVRAYFEILPDLPAHLRHGVFAAPRRYRSWVRLAGPGPFAPADLQDFGQCSIAIKLLDVAGPKLIDDERHTQDLILLSGSTFVTPDVRENAKVQSHVRARRPVIYFVNPLDPHLVSAAMQFLDSRVHSSPLETRYHSIVPFLLGEGQAMQYSLRPVLATKTRVGPRPSPDYLREALVSTLSEHDWSFDFMIQVQTDPHRMPVENAHVRWPEKLSPHVPVARLRIPAQQLDSDEQRWFAHNLSFNPWHSLPEHRPLGSQNRARKQMYLELSRWRQKMNTAPHVEPTGDEVFPGSDPLP